MSVVEQITEVFEYLLKVNSIILALFGVSIIGAIKVFYSARKKQRKLTDARLFNLEQANLAILHNKIYRQCAEHLEAEHISISDLDDLAYLFRAYKALGGNGTGESLYNEVSKLPKIKKEGN